MAVGIKDAAKLVSVSVIMCCAVLVCTMFLNFYFDLIMIQDQLVTEQEAVVYQAQASSAQVVCLVTGGCLLTTSAIMLLFYIKRYIDTRRKQLGILKALGYSSLSIARHFWRFGACVLIGSALGFGGAFLLMPLFYQMQNKDGLLPEITIGFHPSVPLCFVVVPTVAFSLLAIAYACFILKSPVLKLLRDSPPTSGKRKRAPRNDTLSFLKGLKRSTLTSKKILMFFILFSSLCYSSMTQMSFGMRDLSSPMMGAMMLLIGLTLASVTLFLAVTTVINGNRKTIAMMRLFGYSQKECCRALLGGYRPLSYIGFALGTLYQYGLLRLMVDIVFRDMEGVPVYEFDFPMMLLSLASFAAIYEMIMGWYAGQIRKIPIREIMLD